MTEGGDEPPDPAHIGIRAFGLDRLAGRPVVLVDGADSTRARARARARRRSRSGWSRPRSWSGQELELEDLLARGAPLEGHSDNLAACLAGGACLTWAGRIARLADSLPVTPVAVIPREKVTTPEARDSRCRRRCRTRDAAFNVARAALLGRRDRRVADASLAGGRVRATACTSPTGPRALLDAIRADLPVGAVGATLSGSGPTVIVWAEDAEACATELAARFPDERC